jgi:hypothetical protein
LRKEDGTGDFPMGIRHKMSDAMEEDFWTELQNYGNGRMDTEESRFSLIFEIL